MAYLVSPNLAVTLYHVLSQSGLSKDPKLAVTVETLGHSNDLVKQASVVAADESINIAVLQLASDTDFSLPAGLIPATNIAPAGKWSAYCLQADSKAGLYVSGVAGGPFRMGNDEYQLLELDKPMPSKGGLSGAPVIWNEQLIGVLSLASADGSSWYATLISQEVIQSLISSQASNAAPTPTPESPPLPFDLGKYQLSFGANTILHGAATYAARNDALVSTSFVLLEIAGQGRGGRERQWAADFLLDAVSAQPGKFHELTPRFPGEPSPRHRPSPRPPASVSRQEASLMKAGLAWSLNVAQTIATETTGGAIISARHLLAALIIDVPQPYSLGSQRLLAEIGVDLPLLRQRMYEWVRGYGDDDTRWRALLIGAGTELRRKVEFAADIATGLDLIGIEQDVLALATLIAARDSSPPLSIGLFGEWGSGKTFFMGQLRSAIAQFSKEAREANVMQRDLPFYKRIVQIDFNAWHYVEGNLWASMVEHILENLRVSDDQKLTATETLQQHWIAKLGFTEKAKEEADKKQSEASAREVEAVADVEGARKTHELKKADPQDLSRKNTARAFRLSV